MTKRIAITPEIEGMFRKAVSDEGALLTNFAVFEASILNTKKLRRATGFYAAAKVSRSTLVAMEAELNKDGGARHLQVMHENDILPVGRIFSAKLMDTNDGESDLRAFIAVPLDRTQLVSDIENSVIDEVSVGIKAKSALCSECGFDYFGADSTFMNLMTQTCGNEHTIGEDGIHVNLVGLDQFFEVSLVNRGAAQDAKILSKAKQSLSKSTVDRLAASSNLSLDATITILQTKLEAEQASGVQQPSNGENKMDKEALILFQAQAGENANMKVQLTETNQKLVTSENEVTSLKATLSAKELELKTLQDANAEVTPVVAKLAEVEKDMKEAFEEILPHVTAALTAMGATETDSPKDLKSALALIKKAGLKLHQTFGADASTVGNKDGVVDNKNLTSSLAAFKINKK